MTPLEKAQQILDDLVVYADANCDFAVPKLQYVQVGTPVLSCEVLTVAQIDVTPHEQYGPTECNASQLATYLVILAWDCSWVSDTNGVDDPRRVAEVSQKLDAAGTLLWNFANQYIAYLSKQWSVTWTLDTAGLGVTTLSLTIGVD